ncbi:FAD-dependent oxidoreductase [Candidatus Berkiella aquae]|uniref:FAD-dependent oxidoreductase n=1 Tax=Candidatus Berkiella aquae TaxID=295108 RepID=A0A0Q9YRT9_9GAMM|nr:FAD-dependent oxidoreductase [Candidatus Berkiella aquae]MCS5709948.1 FAD-dependent oxidoreductase [Candidatus Berkiella aquae]
MSDSHSRRQFLKWLGLAGLGALAWPLGKYAYQQAFSAPRITSQGISPEYAHRLRNAAFPPVQKTYRTQVAIIGSGVAGLSAALHLQQQGIRDFRVLELESIIGGNAASGQNDVSAFPWGAHYLPVLSEESAFLYPFLQAANIITGFNQQGLPYYNEFYLCHDLKERLYLNGSWQEGLVPHQGLTPAEQAEIERFFALMKYYKHIKGVDGRNAFAIPVDLSSTDESFVRLDALTMADFLNQQHFYSPYLRWYINYCCRDDFGGGIDTVSAWAGIHYFAARRPRIANGDDDAILVWPEGNGFLVNQLAKGFQDKIQTDCLVYNVQVQDEKIAIHYFDGKSQQSAAYLADYVIMAIPRFVAKQICHLDFAPCFANHDKLQYAPWIVANITLTGEPKRNGADIAWDNVSYYSPSLGYIHAKHQSLQARRHNTVITYYLPLDDVTPKLARQTALNRTPQEWRQHIVNDLENMHPGISLLISDIQYRVLGHGMICPTPHLVWRERQQLQRAQGKLFFAHSDMSGLSLFEEAFWQGMQTANAVIRTLGSTLVQS